MSTRQLRLNSLDQIRKRLKEFIGQKINVVFTDNTVALVELVGVQDSSIEVMNMRLRKIKIPLLTISEIYFDTKE